jgi:hypothetical protein
MLSVDAVTVGPELNGTLALAVLFEPGNSTGQRLHVD